MRLTFLRLAAAVAIVATALTAPAATVWSRSIENIKIPRNSRAEFKKASYFSGDWLITIKGVEVREEGGQPTWVFFYQNTHGEPHYVTIEVQCRDLRQKDLTKFKFTGTLVANQLDESQIAAAMNVDPSIWKNAVFARIVIDFMSGAD